MDCLPWWHFRILEIGAATRRYGQWKVHGCPQALGGQDVVPCVPEKMRAKVEADLQAAGLWQGHLPMTVYAMARNLMSEMGGMEDKTPPEVWVAIAEAAVNRQRSRPDKWKVIEDELMHTDSSGAKWFGKQRGQNPAASTSQDPEFVHFYIADLVLRGQTGNFARGAVMYFDPKVQDQVRAACLARGHSDCDPSARSVVASWTGDGGALWVGPGLPGINPRRMLLFWDRATSLRVYRTQPIFFAERMAQTYAAIVTDHHEDETVWDLPACEGVRPSPIMRLVSGAAAMLGVAGALFAGGYLMSVYHRTRRV